jgi:type IV secretion system protein VirB10
MNTENRIVGERAEARMQVAKTLGEKARRSLVGLILAGVVLVALAWYFLGILHRSSDTSARAPKSSRDLLTSEMRLPKLDPGLRTTTETISRADGTPGKVDEVPIAQGRAFPHAQMREPGLGDLENPSPVDVRIPVLVRPSPPAAASDPVIRHEPSGDSDGSARPSPAGPAHGSMGGPQIAVVKALTLPQQRWLLPKGSFLNCILETAIDSTLPGFATCVVSSDVYGADGRVVLLERGTRLIGELRSDVRQGQARVAVIWTEARTPTGIVVPLAAPGTDGLGRAGVPGVVDRHTADRLGAALLLSFVDGAITAVTTKSQGSGAIVYNAQTSRDVATEALRNSIGIPPTIRVAAGARLSVTVVKDVDFSDVYTVADHAQQ